MADRAQPISFSIGAGIVAALAVPALILLTGAAVTQFNVAPLVSSVFGEDPKSPENVDAFKTMYLDVMFSGLIIAENAHA